MTFILATVCASIINTALATSVWIRYRQYRQGLAFVAIVASLIAINIGNVVRQSAPEQSLAHAASIFTSTMLSLHTLALLLFFGALYMSQWWERPGRVWLVAAPYLLAATCVLLDGIAGSRLIIAATEAAGTELVRARPGPLGSLFVFAFTLGWFPHLWILGVTFLRQPTQRWPLAFLFIVLAFSIFLGVLVQQGSSMLFLALLFRPVALTTVLGYMLLRGRIFETTEIGIQQAIESMTDGLAVIAPDGTVLRGNRSMQELLQVYENGVLGSESTRENAAHALRDLCGPERRETILSSHDRVIGVTASPIRDQANNVQGHLILARDITQTQAYERALERIVRERTVELITANEQLRREIVERERIEDQFRQAQKMESIGRLAGGVAHDFNNILTAVIGFTDLAFMHVPRDHPIVAELNEIRKAAERAASLTRQLLAFARKQIINPRVVDLNGLILDMDMLLRRLIGADVELRTLPAAELWTIKADLGQLEQVLVNLVVNARDAMPAGGKLIIETANVVLDEFYAETHIEVTPGSYVMLAVSDTGTGMPPDVQKHLFEPFFTTKETGKGTGLGLATVYGIVKQHGGSIWVYSEVGQGTTIKVYLPHVGAQVAPMPQPSAPETLPRGVETVLVVEDEDAVRNMVIRVLRAQGYAVLEATNGVHAQRLAHDYTGEIHLLIADVVMPQMGGKALADRLLHSRPQMKVLFVSGYTDDAIVHHGQLDHDVIFLQKPFTPAQIARKVREVLHTTMTATPFIEAQSD